MIAANKPFRTTEQLASILIDERGLACNDRDQLICFLRNTNYYRFTGYARQWQTNPLQHIDDFEDGASFEAIHDIMQLDNQLRLIILKQLSVVEPAIRTRFTHELGRTYGNKAFYLQHDFYVGGQDSFGRDIDTVSELLSDINRSRSLMIQHYSDTTYRKGTPDYYYNLPIWVAVEVLSFGKIVKMIAQLNDIAPAKEVAKQISVQWVPFASTLRSFVVLRNMCAHHSQLWHRPMNSQCRVPKKFKRHEPKFDQSSVYSTIIMLNLYRKCIDGDTTISDAMHSLILDNPTFADGILNPTPR